MNNEENNTKEQQEETTPSLHTLEGDLLASMKNDNYASNIVKIVTDGKNGGKGNEGKSASDTLRTTPSKPLNIKLIAFIGLIVVLGIGARVWYTVKKPKTVESPAATSTPQQGTTAIAQMPPVFDADIVLPIQMANTDKEGLLRTIAAAKQDLLANKISNKTNITLSTDVSLRDFFNKILYTGKENLLRSISVDQAYNFGLYHTAGTEFESYLLIKIDTFDLAFSGMLDWETSMPYDLEKIFTYSPKVATSTTITLASSTASSTASTTPEVLQTPIQDETTYRRPNFTDKVIKNIDTRVYTDPVKGVQIIYGIINKKYLLITSGENAFVDIVNKLLVKNVLR